MTRVSLTKSARSALSSLPRTATSTTLTFMKSAPAKSAHGGGKV